MNRLRYLLVPGYLLLLLPFRSTAQSNSESSETCYPIQIEIYAAQSDCDSGAEPAAVGQLYADDTCRATQVIRSSSTNVTYQFPGRYIAKCNGDQLEISDSGCLNSDCSNSNADTDDGDEICDRAFTPASFYSRLPSPVYPLQQSVSVNQRFCMVLSDPEGNSIIFSLIGDCTEACGDRTAVPSSSPPTDAPTASPSTEEDIQEEEDPPTSEPSLTPTPEPSPEPSRLRPPSRAPTEKEPDTTEKDEPTPSPVRNTLRPSATPAPTTRPPTNAAGISSPTEPDTAESNSKAIGIIVGSIVAGFCAVIIVLLVGFFLGVFRQRKIDERSRESRSYEDGEYYDNNNTGGVMMGGHGGGPMPAIPAALASTTATARTPPMFESTQIIIPDHEDDISTLGTPLGVNFLDETNTVGESSSYYRNGGGLLDNFKPPQIQPEEAALFATLNHSEFLSSESKAVYDDEKTCEHFEDKHDHSNSDNATGGTTPRAGAGAANVFDGAIHFIVTAPPGKLGMVIDDYCNVAGGSSSASNNNVSSASPHSNMATTSAFGSPTVHALKDDSILKQRGVRVGDLLETVDGVDVKDLNCLDVSRMITSKSTATRALGFSRKKAI